MPRVLQHLLGRTLLDDTAALHHHDSVSDIGHDPEIMRDEEHARVVPPLQILDQGKDLCLRRDVEGGRRLVGDEEVRVEHHGSRDHDALALAARDLVRIGIVEALGIWQAHGGQDLDDLGLALAILELGMDAQDLVDLLADGLDRVEGRHRLLKNHRHARAAQAPQACRRGLENVLAVEPDLARNGGKLALRQETHDREGGNRLAGTRLPDDADDLAAAHTE